MSYSKLKYALVGFICSFILIQSQIAATVKVVAITQEFASIAADIGGEYVKTTTLIKGSRNLHNINPKPSMVMKVKDADMIIRLGMKQDSWIDGLITVAKNNRIFPGKKGYVDASARIDKLEVPEGNLDGSMGDVHIEGNPHYWLNPTNGIIIAAQIRDHLIQIDPNNSQAYSANYQRFETAITQKYEDWKQQLTPLKKRIFVAYHKVWPYFFEAFGLTSIGELEPLPGIPPTTKQLLKLKQTVAEYNQSPLIITANYYPKKVGDRFAKMVSGKHVVLYPSVDGVKSHTYTELFDVMVKELTTH